MKEKILKKVRSDNQALEIAKRAKTLVTECQTCPGKNKDADKGLKNLVTDFRKRIEEIGTEKEKKILKKISDINLYKDIINQAN